MANFNKVILAGNLTRDPQLSYLPNNTPVCECGLAVNRKWRSPDGQMREETCFVDISLFARQAETFNQYMSKGRPVLLEGRLKFRQWDAKDGTKRSKLSVIVDSFQFMDSKGAASGTRPAAAPARAPAPSPAAAPRQYDEPAPAEYPQEDYGPPAEEQPPPAEEQPPSGDGIPF